MQFYDILFGLATTGVLTHCGYLHQDISGIRKNMHICMERYGDFCASILHYWLTKMLVGAPLYYIHMNIIVMEKQPVNERRLVLFTACLLFQLLCIIRQNSAL